MRIAIRFLVDVLAQVLYTLTRRTESLWDVACILLVGSIGSVVDDDIGLLWTLALVVVLIVPLTALGRVLEGFADGWRELKKKR